MKKNLTSVKDAVVRNRTKILATVAVVATTVAVVEQIGLRQHNRFLEEKGLTTEYYTPDAD